VARIPLYMHRVAGWEVVTTSVQANLGELQFLEGKMDRLEVITNRFKDLSLQQKALSSSKQDVSQEMQELFREGETLVDMLRTSVRQHYGLSSEKLVEFGLQPSRPRSRKAPVPPGPEAPAPAEDAADAAPDSLADPASTR
jgi:hypothetical protein